MLVDDLGRRWAHWRWPVYGLVVVATGVSSPVPLLAPLSFALSMVLIQVFLVRRPLRWLGRGRRLATRVTLKLLLATLTWVGVLINTVLAPLLGIAQVAIVAWSTLAAVIFMEGSLWLVRNRLRREATQPRLDAWEVLVPGTLVTGLLGLTLLLLLTSYGVVHLLLWTEIPGLSDIAEFLLDAKGGR